MVSDLDFLVGVKLTDSPQDRNVWDRIKKVEKGGLCLNCERHRWKNKEVKLCDKCYRSCLREKCIHCKEEFSNHKFCRKAEATYKRHVCLNCARNIATYHTDAKLCRFCSCWSAWRETSECDRCFKSLEKFGNPSSCESCNKNCAFDRGEESRNKVAGLKLCFLCTYDFKKNDYYNKRRLTINHNHSNNSTSDYSKTDEPLDSERKKRALQDTPEGFNRPDPEKEMLRKRVSELEAELAALKESHRELESRHNFV